MYKYAYGISRGSKGRVLHLQNSIVMVSICLVLSDLSLLPYVQMPKALFKATAKGKCSLLDIDRELLMALSATCEPSTTNV